MARTRTLRPSFWKSFTLGSISREARLTFVGLWTEADDEGRAIDAPKALAGALFPHDEDVTGDDITRWLDELESVGAILRYEAKGGRYLHILGWDEHQKPPHATPSGLPAPPDSRKFPENSETFMPMSLSLFMSLSRFMSMSLGHSFPECGAGSGTSFDAFYDAYPRKVGKSAARRAWGVATKTVPPEVIVSAATRFANDPNLPLDKNFIPHPSTWLNQGRWDDEPLPPRVVYSRSKPDRGTDAMHSLHQRYSAETAAES